MPKGIYIRTKKYRLEAAEKQRGKKYSKESRQKMSNSHKGKIFQKSKKEKLD